MSVLSGDNVPALRLLFAADAQTRPAAGDLTWDTLPPVWSGGQTDRPDVALVFANPTYRNQSVGYSRSQADSQRMRDRSHSRLDSPGADDRSHLEGDSQERSDRSQQETDSQGSIDRSQGFRDRQRTSAIWPEQYRAPHIGFRRVWRFLVSCGLLNFDPLELPKDLEWQPEDAVRAYEAAALDGLYITNLVKACRTTSEMPSPQFAKQYVGLLRDELAIVRPRYAVALGGLVTEMLTGRSFVMREAYEYLQAFGHPMMLTATAPGWLNVVPCYFPGGRGEPAKAREIISALAYENARPVEDGRSELLLCYVPASSRALRAAASIAVTQSELEITCFSAATFTNRSSLGSKYGPRRTGTVM